MLINAILLDMIIEEDNIFSLFFLKIFFIAIFDAKATVF